MSPFRTTDGTPIDPHPVAMAKLEALKASGWSITMSEAYAPEALIPRTYGVAAVAPEGEEGGVTVWSDSPTMAINQAARLLGAEWDS